MPSVVEVWNLSLSRIGSSALVNSETENSSEANAARLVYPTTRDTLLRAFPWPFASKVVTLADLGSPFDNWAYRYRYPSDCVFARKILTGARTTADPSPFRVAWDETADLVILTDIEDADLEYTARVTDPNAWDPQFLHALTWLLGSELAFSITQSTKIREQTLQIYGQIVAAAWAQAQNEGEPDVEREASWIRQRS